MADASVEVDVVVVVVVVDSRVRDVLVLVGVCDGGGGEDCIVVMVWLGLCIIFALVWLVGVRASTVPTPSVPCTSNKCG